MADISRVMPFAPFVMEGTVIEGAFRDVPEGVYRAFPALSGTEIQPAGRGLAYLAAKRAKRAKRAKAAEDDDPKKRRDFDFGKLAHAVLLEGLAATPEAVIAAGFAIKPDNHDGRSATGKKWIADNAGKPLLEADDLEVVRAMGSAVSAHKWANGLLRQPGLSELSVRARHPRYGIWLKARYDKAPEGGDILVDYKTTANAAPEEFARSIFAYGYLLQAAHYLFLSELVGLGYRRWYWVAQEKTAPYALAVYSFGPGDEKWDEVQYVLDRIYARVAAGEKAGDYSATGLPDHPVKAALPNWAKVVAEGIYIEPEDA